MLQTVNVFRIMYLSVPLILIAILLPISEPAMGASHPKIAASVTTIDLIEISTRKAVIAYNLDSLKTNSEHILDTEYKSYRFDDQSEAVKNGFPALPHIIKYILIPPQSGVELIVQHINSHIEHGVTLQKQIIDTGIENNQSAADLTAHSVNAEGEWAAEYLQTEGFFPSEVVRIGTPVILRGNRMLPVIINPLRWNRETNDLEVVDDLKIELDFTSDLNRMNLVIKSAKLRPSAAVEAILDGLVINPPVRDDYAGLRNGSIAYVMGASNNWNQVVEALEPLIEWRRRMGWTVEIIRVQNNGNAAAVKNAIQDAYDDWDVPPEFVVICGDTDGPFPIAFWDMRRGANYAYESDHPYVMLDGDDLLADAAVGRLIFDSIGMLENIVEKTVQYESDPFIGNGNDRGWQKRAAFIAGDNRSGTSSIDMCRWSKNLMLRNGFDEIAELYWTPQNPQPNGQDYVIDNIEDGLSFFTYRGWTFMNGFRFEDVDRLRNGRMLPFVMLATCNTGDYGEHISSLFYYTERFLYNRRGGAIGAVGAAGATHTAYNNLIATATFRAFFSMDIPWQGWGLMNGKVELFINYEAYDDIQHPENQGLEAWECEVYIFNLMGDPAVDLYTDTPRELDLAHPATIRTGETLFEVEVIYHDNDQPAPKVRVCLYKPGEFQLTKFTDENGVVSFGLDPVWTEEGEIMLTVTGHNLMPELVDLDIVEAEVFLGTGGYSLDDDDDGESQGDGDGIANPTEILELTIELLSLGELSPDGEIMVQLLPVLPYIIVDEDVITLESAPDPGQSVELEYLIEIAGGFPVENDAVFTVLVTADEESWQSSITVTVEGPQFDLISLEWVNDELEPGEDARCYLRISNIGEKRSDALEATLISLTPSINVLGGEGSFYAVSPGNSRRSRRPFNLSATIFHVPGATVNLALILESEAGFIDTAFISLPVGQAQDDQPFGPDNYGYICVDDTDTDWYSYPVYDWIEIDPRHRGPGENTELEDVREEDDASLAIDLPFTFTYYGEDFDEITICTNGWIAMGDCSDLITARNRNIPSGMVAPGMICPFWEDLLTTDNGGIFTYFDEDNHLFIVEWSQMRKLGPRGNNEAMETFEVILYDPEHHQSFTGDGDILFQYLDVVDDRSCFQAWDTPFATVGVGSPDQTDGLVYTYGGVLTDGAAPLRDERAILFTTSVLSATGVITGQLIDAATDEPIGGALLYSSLGVTARTDEEGNYVMERAPANMIFELTASADGYNDSTLIEIELEEDEEIEVNFALLHPEILVSHEMIVAEVAVGEEHVSSIQIQNDGNGSLSWISRMRNVVDQEYDPWELRVAYNVGAELDDPRILGCVFANDRFYVAGAGNDNPQIYVLSREGELIETYDQAGDSRLGMADLAYDGELIWGSGEATIFGFTPEGELIESFAGPWRTNKSLAWDPDRELLWVGDVTRNYVGIDREGNEVEHLNRQELRTYGLAYFPEDPDGYNLYIFNNPAGGLMNVHKMDVESGEIEFVVDLSLEREGRASAIFISAEYDYYGWVIMAIANDAADDRIEIWQLAERTDWMTVEPETGLVEPDDSQEIVLTFDSRGIPAGVELEGELEIQHNAAGDEIVLPVSLRILGDEDVELTVSLFEGWNLISLNVSPDRDMYADEDDPGPDILLMTEQLRIDDDHHHITVMKDQEGNFYLPSFGFNGIEYWNLLQSYRIKVDEDVEALWSGRRIPFDRNIPLTEGWNYIAYFPQYDINADAPEFRPLISVIDNVLLAKDNWGGFMLPAFNFSNMNPWRETQGYLVKVDQDVTLNYPPDENDERLAYWIDPHAESTLPLRTDNNMSLLITEVVGSGARPGDVITAYNNNGIAVGMGTVDESGRCGLAIWGNDSYADDKFGLTEGDTFELQLSRASVEAEYSLTPEQFYAGANVNYKRDGLLVLSVRSQIAEPTAFYLNEGYPNPFNSVIQISYGVPNSSSISLKVFDLSGREVSMLKEGHIEAGHYKAVWDAQMAASGVYIARLTSFDQVLTQKIILLR